MNANFTSINAEQYLNKSETGKVLHLIFDAITNELINYKFYQKIIIAHDCAYMSVEDAFYTIDAITRNGITTYAVVSDNKTGKTIASRYVLDSDEKRIVIGIGAKSVPETYNDLFIYSEKAMNECMQDMFIENPDIVRVDLDSNSHNPEILRIVNNNTLEPFDHVYLDKTGLYVNKTNYVIKRNNKQGNSLVSDIHQAESTTISSNSRYNEWLWTNASVELFQYLITKVYNKSLLIDKYKDLALVTKENLFEYYIERM